MQNVRSKLRRSILQPRNRDFSKGQGFTASNGTKTPIECWETRIECWTYRSDICHFFGKQIPTAEVYKRNRNQTQFAHVLHLLKSYRNFFVDFLVLNPKFGFQFLTLLINSSKENYFRNQKLLMML